MAFDSPEFIARSKAPFKPPTADRSEIRAVIPNHLFKRSTTKGLYYVARTVGLAVFFYYLSTFIPLAPSILGLPASVVQACLWANYVWWQGIAYAGFWCLAHEAGHGNLSPKRWVNDLLGFPLHTFVLSPYFSWRVSHDLHHKTAGHIDIDENFIPPTRSTLGLPDISKSIPEDYKEALEEAPIVALGKTLFIQFVGLTYYFATNIMGSPRYPKGTNHFNPSSQLFQPKHFWSIVLTDLGILCMIGLLITCYSNYGMVFLLKHYIPQYFLTNNWIVMVTYLHHSDPTVPHYREKEWTFTRGALATVDRPVMGWIGRFFFMNVSHDHVGHHLFYMIPFYNQPKVTEILKTVLKDDYMYDSTNCFAAFYRTAYQCRFVEDEGQIVMYKDVTGKQLRPLAEGIETH